MEVSSQREREEERGDGVKTKKTKDYNND